MKKQFLLWTGYLSLILLIVSCKPSAHIEKDKDTDFSKYKTFAWIDKDGEGKKDRNRTNDLAEQRIKSAIKAELEKTAGWKEVKNRPDVLLSYDVLVERGTRESSSPVYSRSFTRLVYNPYTRRYTRIYYPPQFMGYDRSTENIREGTVTISMIDAKTDKVVWQGWTTDEVSSRNLTAKEITSAVKSIFKKLDIAKN